MFCVKRGSCNTAFAMVVLVQIIVSFLCHYSLFPALLEPVSHEYNLDFFEKQESRLQCDALQCQLQSTTEKATATIWIESHAGGFFALDYHLNAVSQSDATSSGKTVARIALFPQYQGKLRWDIPHLLFSTEQFGAAQGTTLLHFDVPVDRYQLAIELHRPDSQLQIQKLRLQEYRMTTLLQSLQFILVFVWALIALYVLYYLMQSVKPYRWMLVCTYLTIIVGTQVPNHWFNSIRDLLALSSIQQAQSSVVNEKSITTATEVAKTKNPGPGRLSILKKTAHLLLFTTLTVLLWFQFGPNNFYRNAILITALLATATESAQGLGFSRTPSLFDWGIDMLGAAIGMGAILLFVNKAKLPQ